MLVRGLDYYTKTTFEFISKDLGSQSAFAAGGRYDNLVETFGGRPTPAVGFAAGMERIFLLLERKNIPKNQPEIFLIYSGIPGYKKAFEIMSLFRSNNISADIDPESNSFKSQMKKADREKARYTIIIGDDEIKAGILKIKDMETGEQKDIPEENILEYVSTIVKPQS